MSTSHVTKRRAACALRLIPWLLLSSACTSPTDVQTESFDELQQPYTLDGRKWANRNLTYFFAGGTADIAGTDEYRAVRDAMTLWSLDTPLTFTEKASEAGADIIVKWVTGDHGDGIPFSNNGSLAHGVPPPPGVGTLPGDLHFNDAYAWTMDVRNTAEAPYDLPTIVTHELMHSLGLAHPPGGDFYTGSNRFIPGDSIDGIQQLYGSAQPISVRPIGDATPSLFVRGSDNGIWENWYNGTGWQWSKRIGAVGSTPSTVIYGDTPYIFTREVDGTLAVRNAATWTVRNLGGSFAGAPSAIVWGVSNRNMSAFIRGTDNALWEARWDGSSWSVTSHGGLIHTTPAPMLTGPSTLSVFVMGADHALFERWFNGSSWFWGSHGGELTSAPVAIGTGNDFKVFARGSDNNLWERYWNGSAWVWSAHGGPIRGTPSIASASSVFVRGGDDHLYQNWWNGSTWIWVSHGVSCTSSPTATDKRVFMRSSNGAVGERYWNGSQWVTFDHGSHFLLP